MLNTLTLGLALLGPAGRLLPSEPTSPTPIPPALAIVLAGITEAECLIEGSAFSTRDGGCMDMATELVWGRSSVNFIGGPPWQAATWEDALLYCQDLVEGGFSDWFLPTLPQLQAALQNGAATHVDFGLHSATNLIFWSSTVANANRARSVQIPSGVTENLLKRSLIPYVCVRQGSSASAPVAPSGLSAILVGPNQINLAWSDNSTDEMTFQVDRSFDGSAWSTVASLAANSVSYGDADLAPGQVYFYRVWAANPGGASGYSNVASVMTLAGDAHAYSETAIEGSVSGSHVYTRAADGLYQVLTETHSGGAPSQRISSVAHMWAFTAAAGDTVTLHVKGYRTDTGEGDEFRFSYSTHGNPAWTGAWDDLPGTFTKTVDDGLYSTFTLPSAMGGPVYIMVRDTNRLRGFGALDRLHVDHLFLRTQ